MKKKVKYGALCMAMTAIVFVALGTAIYYGAQRICG